MPAKKKARTEGAVWECHGDDGWQPYADADTALIEAEYVKGVPTFTTSALTFNKGYTTAYTFDFTKMTQTNGDSKKQREVRRVAPLSEVQWEWKDDSGLFVPFYDADSTEIERMYTVAGAGKPQKTKKLSWNKGYGSEYTFTFSESATPAADSSSSGAPASKTVTGTQKNEDSGTIRELRRIQKKLPWALAGYGISGAKLPADIATAVAAAASAAKPSDTVAPAACTAKACDEKGLLTRSATLSIPSHWTSTFAHVFEASGAHGEVLVAPGTEEYECIAGSVKTTLGRTATIVKVTRIENATLWTFYALTRDQIAKKNGGNANERLVFYGERIAKNINTIHKFGFDIRVAEEGLFGTGLYFGVTAAFCDSGRCLQRPDGSKDVLVCRAALGASTVGGKTIRRPPPKDPTKPTMELYDSCIDYKDPPQLYVLFANSQAYPEYVVTYL